MSKLVFVCDVTKLQPGDKMAISPDDQSILVANVDGRIYAVANICTHEYAELVNGFLTGDAITCPLHLSSFKLETGEVMNAPASKPLKTYKVIVSEAKIYVEV
jgi:3-phenylpropionate/trans-cinnamate dioxygenase ferredoxin subunit